MSTENWTERLVATLVSLRAQFSAKARRARVLLTMARSGRQVLGDPLTVAQIEKLADAKGYVEGIVAIDLYEVIDRNLEGFLDLLSHKLIGSCLLGDISYSLVGCSGDELHIEICGDSSMALDGEG